MMKKLIGVFATAALMSSGMALAHDKEKKDTQTQSQSTGGSGTTGQQQSGQLGQSGMTDQLSGNQLTGRVVKSDKKMIWIEHMGAIVPLKIDKNTQFTDPSLKRATDIKEGDQIRASFEVRKTDNVATSIGMSSDMGQGGSGSDVLMPDKGINQPSDRLPPAPGTGGSGREGSDINEGFSPDSSLDSPDVDQDQSKSTGDY
jgi:opacity protein-like surface antigen